MGKDHWDAILASVPSNATAGRVVSSGVHFDPQPEKPGAFRAHEWDVPPPLKSITALRRRYPEFVDYTGLRLGRLVVLGVAVESMDNNKGRKGAMWVCRCACGRYVGRRRHSLKNPVATASCDGCHYTRHLREVTEGDGARRRAEAPEARKW